jgi:hypothetical protein
MNDQEKLAKHMRELRAYTHIQATLLNAQFRGHDAPLTVELLEFLEEKICWAQKLVDELTPAPSPAEAAPTEPVPPPTASDAVTVPADEAN